MSIESALLCGRVCRIAPGSQSLVSQLLEKRQDKQELVNRALALQVGWPLPEGFGQGFGACLEGEHSLVHAVDLLHHVLPQQVSVAADCGDHI